MILQAVPCTRCGTYTNKYGHEVVLTWTQNQNGICRLHPIERGDLVNVDLGHFGVRTAEVIFPADGTGQTLLRSVEGHVFRSPISSVSL